MANSLIPFSFETSEVRVIDLDGVAWFILQDVCLVLGIGNPSDVASRLDDDEKADLDTIDTSSAGISQRRKFKAINESGLWAVTMTSRKPEAKRLRKWVTSEVIPSIRKTGSYGTPKPLSRAELARNWAEAEERAEAESAARLLSDQRADAADAAKLLSDQRADHNKNVALKKMERLTQLEKTLGVVVDCGIGRPDEVFHGMTISDAARYFGVQQDWLFAFMGSEKDEVGGGVMPIGWISSKGHKVITKAYAKDGSRAGGAYMRMATIRLPKGYTKQPYLTIWGLDRLGELLAPIPVEVKNNPATLQLARDERRRLRTQKEIDKLSEAAKQGVLSLGEDDEPR